MAKRRDYSARTDEAIIVLKRAGWTNAKIAEAFCITPIALEHRITRQRRKGLLKGGPFRERPTAPRLRPEDSPIEGEQWREVAELGLRVSSEGRVASMASGFLRSPFKESNTGAWGVNYEAHGKKGTITMVRLLAMADGRPLPPGAAKYTLEEDRIIAAAKTVEEARAQLPLRTAGALRQRALVIGTSFERSPRRRPARPQQAVAKLALDYVAILEFAKRFPADVRWELTGEV